MGVRQRDAESRARTNDAIEANRAAVRFDDSTRDRQAETGAVDTGDSRVRGPEEAAEHLTLLPFGYADAAVSHRDRRGLTGARHRGTGGTTVRRVLVAFDTGCRGPVEPPWVALGCDTDSTSI